MKDMFMAIVFLTIYAFFVFYMGNYMGHPDNFIRANPVVTPAHIVPEWYFLPFYAVLRAIPDKLGWCDRHVWFDHGCGHSALAGSQSDPLLALSSHGLGSSLQALC